MAGIRVYSALWYNVVVRNGSGGAGGCGNNGVQMMPSTTNSHPPKTLEAVREL